MKTLTRERHATISAHDFDRLNELVQSPKFRATQAPAVAHLEQELRAGEVVPPTEVPPGVVTMNSRVEFREVGSRDNDHETFTLVYPGEADIDEGKLSVLAPLGVALLGAKVGDVVECRTPAGVRRLKVEQVLYQPEEAGDYHL